MQRNIAFMTLSTSQPAKGHSMPDPIPLNLNVTFGSLRADTDRLVRHAAIVSSGMTYCGNCGDDIRTGRCDDCGIHAQVVLALTGPESNQELSRQAREAFPNLPFCGFADPRDEPKQGETYYRISLLSLPHS